MDEQRAERHACVSDDSEDVPLPKWNLAPRRKRKFVQEEDFEAEPAKPMGFLRAIDAVDNDKISAQQQEGKPVGFLSMIPEGNDTTSKANATSSKEGRPMGFLSMLSESDKIKKEGSTGREMQFAGVRGVARSDGANEPSGGLTMGFMNLLSLSDTPTRGRTRSKSDVCALAPPMTMGFMAAIEKTDANSKTVSRTVSDQDSQDSDSDRIRSSSGRLKYAEETSDGKPKGFLSSLSSSDRKALKKEAKRSSETQKRRSYDEKRSSGEEQKSSSADTVATISGSPALSRCRSPVVEGKPMGFLGAIADAEEREVLNHAKKAQSVPYGNPDNITEQSKGDGFLNMVINHAEGRRRRAASLVQGKPMGFLGAIETDVEEGTEPLPASPLRESREAASPQREHSEVEKEQDCEDYDDTEYDTSSIYFTPDEGATHTNERRPRISFMESLALEEEATKAKLAYSLELRTDEDTISEDELSSSRISLYLGAGGEGMPKPDGTITLVAVPQGMESAESFSDSSSSRKSCRLSVRMDNDEQAKPMGFLELFAGANTNDLDGIPLLQPGSGSLDYQSISEREASSPGGFLSKKKDKKPAAPEPDEILAGGKPMGFLELFAEQTVDGKSQGISCTFSAKEKDAAENRRKNTGSAIKRKTSRVGSRVSKLLRIQDTSGKPMGFLHLASVDYEQTTKESILSPRSQQAQLQEKAASTAAQPTGFMQYVDPPHVDLPTKWICPSEKKPKPSSGDLPGDSIVKMPRPQSTKKSLFKKLKGFKRDKLTRGESLSDVLATSIAAFTDSHSDAEIESLFDRFCDPIAGVGQKTHVWLGTSYCNSFVASEGVSWICDDPLVFDSSENNISHRAKAVGIGRVLVRSGFIHHVTHSENFADNNSLFVVVHREQQMREKEAELRGRSSQANINFQLVCKVVAGLLAKEDGLLLASLYCVAGAKKIKVLECLMQILAQCDMTLPFIINQIKLHVSMTSQETTLFRTNSLCTDILSRYTRLISRTYLEDIINPIIRTVLELDIDYEVRVEVLSLVFFVQVDNHFSADTLSREALEANSRSLSWACKVIFETVVSSIHEIPLEVRFLCNAMYANVGSRFPSSAMTSVGGYFFLRYMCPHVLSFKLSENDKRAKVHQRNLILISTVLQCLSNQQIPRSDSMAAVASEFVLPNQVRMRNFLLELASLSPGDEAALLQWQENQVAASGIRRILSQVGISYITYVDPSGWSALHSCASNGDLAGLSKLLTVPDVDVSTRNADGNTLLHYYCRLTAPEEEWVVLFDRILELGGNVNEQNRFGETPLHRAIARKHRTAVSALLAAGAEMLMCTNDLLAPIHFAARSGDPTIVQMLLDHGAHPCPKPTVNGNGDDIRPSYLASRYPKIAELLEQATIDSNTPPSHLLIPDSNPTSPPPSYSAPRPPLSTLPELRDLSDDSSLSEPLYSPVRSSSEDVRPSEGPKSLGEIIDMLNLTDEEQVVANQWLEYEDGKNVRDMYTFIAGREETLLNELSSFVNNHEHKLGPLTYSLMGSMRLLYKLADV